MSWVDSTIPKEKTEQPRSFSFLKWEIKKNISSPSPVDSDLQPKQEPHLDQHDDFVPVQTTDPEIPMCRRFGQE